MVSQQSYDRTATEGQHHCSYWLQVLTGRCTLGLCLLQQANVHWQSQNESFSFSFYRDGAHFFSGSLNVDCRLFFTAANAKSTMGHLSNVRRQSAILVVSARSLFKHAICKTQHSNMSRLRRCQPCTCSVPLPPASHVLWQLPFKGGFKRNWTYCLIK